MSNPLRPLRHLFNLTQGQIAEACGISRGLWSMQEARTEEDYDVPPATVRGLIRYAKKRGVDLRYEHFYEGLPLVVDALKPLPSAMKVSKARVGRPKATPAAPPVAAPRTRRRVIASTPAV
jgi:hypothetical protein